jgi:hypothetical protein
MTRQRIVIIINRILLTRKSFFDFLAQPPAAARDG